MRPDEYDDEEVPAGCACCLTALVLPVMFLVIAFVAAWFLG